MKKIVKMYRYLLYIMPLMLVFSYFPLIKLGENETMYFELSLSLIWLVLFDVLGILLVVLKYRREILTKIFGSILWWLFPLFVTFSVIWSLNPLRGVLTVGVMWVLFFAVLCFYNLREYLDAKFWKNFLRWFFGAFIFASLWCVLQCVLDVAGVSQDATLLCDGCVYQMFGFPHPNGFAIEPQFMGNLLLAPVVVSGYFYLAKRDKKYLLLFFAFAATLFLTFSRGAIYACAVGLCFLFTFMYFRAKKADRKSACFSILKTILVLVVSFGFTLNLQGILAASSPTSDTYLDGVSKVLNQLSLGVIDVRNGESGGAQGNENGASVPVENSEKTEGNEVPVGNVVVENSGNVVSSEDVGNFGDTTSQSIYDGYVAESTDTRVRLFRSAISIWHQDLKTATIGVGIGGAGQALYNNGLSPAPREIVQNEYASLLLETGVAGVSLFVVLLIMAIRVFLKAPSAGLLLALLISYGVSLLFFSGLTNALQIVLIPGILVLLPKLKVKSN